MKILIRLVLLFLLLQINVFAQDTFSKFYDFDTGIDDQPLSMLLEQDVFIVSLAFSGDSSIVSSLARFNFTGDILTYRKYDDFVIGLEESIIKTSEGYEMVGKRWSLDKSGATGTRLVYIDKDFVPIKDTLLFFETSVATNTYGIQNEGTEKRIYFEVIDQTNGACAKGNIIFLDSENDTITQEIRIEGIQGMPYRQFDIRALEETEDGGYLFMARSDLTTFGSPNLFELTKINRQGEIINKITGKHSGLNRTLAQDEEGNVYFFTNETPFLIDSTVTFPDAAGGIAKVNSDLDSVIWSRPLTVSIDPYDLDRKRHTAHGILPLEDKSFLAFGEVRDNDVGKDIGFMVKFDQDGELLWSRFYRPLFEQSFTKKSSLIDCNELPDGRILCMGRSNNMEFSGVLGNELWLLMVDENGCLFPNCEQETVITSDSSELLSQQGEIYPNPVSDILHIADVSFDEYKIYDLMGRLIQHGDFVSEIHLRGQMSSGMFVLQLKEKGRLKSVFKFLKE